MQLQTELNTRTLRFDGVSILEPARIADALVRGVPPSKIRVQGDDEEIQLFNSMVTDAEQLLAAKAEPISLSMAWNLPEPHLSMDLEGTIVARAVDRLKELQYSPEIDAIAIQRIQDELDEIKKRGMVEFMRTVIYVLDTFRRKNIVWGVGRGSSCACYILFILGLHAVDCVLLDVPMSEFFHD